MPLIVALLACKPEPTPDTDPPDTDPAVDDTHTSVDDSDTPPDDTAPPPQPCLAGVAAQRGPIPYATLQAALDEALPGDVVDVCPGVYPGQHTWSGAGDLTVQGFTGDPADVTLDADLQGGALLLQPASGDVTVRGLTFVHAAGDASVFSALHVRYDPRGPAGDLAVKDCHFRDNTNRWDGAALYADSANHVTLAGLVVEDNACTDVGAPVTILRPRDAVIVTDSTFRHNAGAGFGALAVFHLEPDATPFTATLLRNTFSGNTIPVSGSGAGATLSINTPGRHTVHVADNAFTGNRSGDRPDRNYNGVGGALAVTMSLREASVDAVFERNAFDDSVGAIGHLSLAINSAYDTSQITIRDSSFYRADSGPTWTYLIDGAAIYLEPAVVSPLYAEVTLEDVDMGSGSTANLRRDFAHCETDYDGLVSGHLDAIGDVCP